ncbi:hypothetical protein AMTRI_Chr07g80080 [Amborella trichopoda]
MISRVANFLRIHSKPHVSSLTEVPAKLHPYHLQILTIRGAHINPSTDENLGSVNERFEGAKENMASQNIISEPSDSSPETPNISYAASSSLKVSTRHNLAMIYTCRVCETRSVKTVCRESYEKGVVVVKCNGCNNLHLIADRLGWFGEPGSIEDFLATRGEEVKKGSPEAMSLTLEDLAGLRSSST